MAFQSMLSGAECSASQNHLSQFLKHTQTDRSLQQDAVQTQPGMMQRPGFRTRPGGVGGGVQDMDAFLRQPPATGALPFDMHAMRSEMEAMQMRAPPSSAWAQEMQQRPPAPAPGRPSA